MKTNHQQVIHHITEAIRACKEDSALSATKSNLYAILRLAEGVANKRATRQSQTEYFTKYYKELAEKRDEQWREMLKNNLKLQMPKEDNNDKK